ncbi:MAG: Respiratory supercomplex factor 1, mitochondrial [Bathelium mastoideum]|nr:MAG: Respiratory supercomplex factor 1, mitochondrial [Bathelium mastoideum]KAI9689055.1 MAG: Respiratory supercomplex factor 1, mitochondrial [Bathelium mastoideum]
MGDAPLPSSFDSDPEFFEENRWQKLGRRLKEEPLIPLGCLLTCWALFGASRSMRSGDHNATNRFFRRRIYAQGFTIAAMFVGSVYWETDRQKRKQYDDVVKEQKAREKRDAWLRELEVRDEEEKAIQARMSARRRKDQERAVVEARRGSAEGEEGGGSVVQMVKDLGKKGENKGLAGTSADEDGGAASREGSSIQVDKDWSQRR